MEPDDLREWVRLDNKPLVAGIPSYHTHCDTIKHYTDVLPTIGLLGESVKEWYPHPPDATVKVAIVTRPCNSNWLYNFGTHWGVYINGEYIHWYGLDKHSKEWMMRRSTLEEFSRESAIVTYVLRDYYHPVIHERIAQRWCPGKHHPLFNNCQHGIQKLVYGELLMSQTNALLESMELTKSAPICDIYRPQT